jgi:hypothetical protein
MPGRTRGQLTFFDQQDIVATFLGEVVEQADAHDAAPDDDDACMCLNS